MIKENQEPEKKDKEDPDIEEINFSSMDHIQMMNWKPKAATDMQKMIRQVIGRLSKGLLPSLQFKIRNLMSKERPAIDTSSMPILKELENVQSILYNARDITKEVDPIEPVFSSQKELIDRIFENPQNEPNPTKLGSGIFLRNYFSIQNQNWQINHLSRQVNESEARNRSSMIKFLSDSDCLANLAINLLNPQDLGSMTFSGVSSNVGDFYLLKANGVPLKIISNYTRSKYQGKIVTVPKFKSEFSLLSDASRSPTFNPNLATIPVLIDPLYLPVNEATENKEQSAHYRVDDRLQPLLQDAIDHLRIDDSRGYEIIYELLAKMINKLNNNFKKIFECQFRYFLPQAINCLITESIDFYQRNFWQNIRKEYPITPSIAIPPTISDKLGRVLNFTETQLRSSNEPIFDRDHNNLPIWALLFYALRSGLYDEIFEFLLNYNGSAYEELKSFSRSFIDFIKNLKIENLSFSHQKVQELKSRTEGAKMLSEEIIFKDDYKRAIMHILHRKNVQPERFLVPGVFDSIWLQLHFCFENEEEPMTYKLLNFHDLLRSMDWTSTPESSQMLPVYQVFALMFDNCVDSLFNIVHNSKDALNIAFIVNESRLAQIIQAYQESASKQKEIPPSSDLIVKYANTIGLSEWENAVALMSCLPLATERRKALIKYASIQQFFQYMFGNQERRKKVPNALKLLISVPEYNHFVQESLRNFQSKEDWRNFGILSNAYQEIGAIYDLCRLTIELRYEQIKRIVSEDKLDQGEFILVQEEVDRNFKEALPKMDKNHFLYKAAIACTQIHNIFYHVLLKKISDNFEIFQIENFSSFLPNCLFGSYYMIYQWFINLGLKVCRQRVMDNMSASENLKILRVVEKIHNFQKTINENSLCEDSRYQNVIQMKQCNISLYTEIRGISQKFIRD